MDLSSYFQRTKGFWALAHVFKGLKVLDLNSCFKRNKDFLGFGSCFQRTKGSRSCHLANFESTKPGGIQG